MNVGPAKDCPAPSTLRRVACLATRSTLLRTGPARAASCLIIRCGRRTPSPALCCPRRSKWPRRSGNCVSSRPAARGEPQAVDPCGDHPQMNPRRLVDADRLVRNGQARTEVVETCRAVPPKSTAPLADEAAGDYLRLTVRLRLYWPLCSLRSFQPIIHSIDTQSKQRILHRNHALEHCAIV